MYAHHGAGKFKCLTDEHFHSEKEVTDEDIETRFNEIWEHSESKGEELETASSLDEIVDVEDICIEAYIIEDQDGEYHVILPTITSQVNVAVTKPVNEIYDLHDLRNLNRKLQNYIQIAEEQGLAESKIREGVRKALTKYRKDGRTLLIEEDESAQTRVFNRLSRVMS